MQFFFFVNTCDNNSVQKTSTRQFYRKTEKSTKTLTALQHPVIFELLPGAILQERGCQRMKSEDYSKIVEQVKALSDADREALLTYLRSLTGSAGSSKPPAACRPEDAQTAP